MMESAIRLSHYPIPSAPLRLWKDAQRFHPRFNHCIGTPLSLTRFSNSNHPVAPSLRHVNCMLKRPSKNISDGSDNKNKTMRGVTRVSLVLACVLGLFNFSSKTNPKFKIAFANGMPRSFDQMAASMDSPGGKIALDSLADMIDAEYSNNQKFSAFAQEPNDDQIRELKLRVIGLSKSGKRDRALRILQDAYDKWKGHSAAEQGLGMALAELHLFQGNFEVALKLLDDRIKSIDEKFPSNGTPEQKCESLRQLYEDSNLQKRIIAHLLLYKAIVHSMLENVKADKWPKGKVAVAWLQAFREICESR